ncbi:MAG TPA: twin-arginine translocation signal domain-containing protein [Longimicrobiales bacterium]|nr:twin-arginine translocation signal domain-containing protein [Longimicrobiales bacterium]
MTRPADHGTAAHPRAPIGGRMPAADPRSVDAARAPQAGLDRRSFLRATAGGGAAIALASALPPGSLAAYPAALQDGARLQALSPKQYAVARAAAEALLVDVPADPGAVARSMDADLAAVGDPIRSDMRTVLTLLEHLTPLAFRFRRFTSLDVDARRAYLMTWARSRFNLRRAAFQATRGFLCFNAYLREETWGVTGFPGPWPGRIERPVLPVDFGEIA